jgi:hypothetical protein
MRVFRFFARLAVVLTGCLLSACASKPLRVRDLPASEATWMQGRETVADGSHLKMIFRHDAERLRIDRIDYKIRDGDLYIWPVRTSELFAPIEFTLDTARLKLKQPWQEHVYWVGAVDWDGALGHLVNSDPLGDRVERVKADVSEGKGEDKKSEDRR